MKNNIKDYDEIINILDGAKTIVISTDNGDYIMGTKNKILASITNLINQLYARKEISEKEIDKICRLSKMNLRELEEESKRTSELKEILHSILQKILKDEDKKKRRRNYD